MANDMKLYLELIAKTARFKNELNSSRGAVGNFAKGVKSELSSLKGLFGSVHGQLASLGLGLGAGKIMKDSASLDKSMTQIGQTAGETGEKVKGLRKDLFDMSRESGKQIEGLKDGFDNLIQSGLDWKSAKETIGAINIGSAVTNASEATLAGGLTVAATAYNFDLSKPGLALEMLDKMTVAGRLGNAELEDLANIFARVGVNAVSAGMDFEPTLAFIEGLSLVEKNAERLATLADSTMRVFTNLNYMKEAQKATGVKFFDAKGARRDAVDVLTDIKKIYDTLNTDQERALFIQKAFGKADLDTIKGIKTLLQGDSLDKVKAFSAQIAEAGGTLKKDFGDATRNLIDQTGMLKNDLRQAADGFVGPINETLGHWIQFARDKKENGGLELDGKDMIAGAGIATVGTLLAARYGSKALSAGASKFLKGSGSLAAGVTQGKALEAATGVIPVFVTNFPAGGIGGGALGGGAAEVATGGALATILGKGKALGKGALALAKNLAPRAGLVGAAGAGGYAVGTGLNKTMGWMSGLASGGQYSGSGWLGERIYDMTHESRTDNNIILNIDIDGNGRVVSKSDDPNTSMKINSMKRGSFAPSMPPAY